MSKKDKSFFDRLSSKVEKQVTHSSFDREFWTKFDQEFSTSKTLTATGFVANLKSLFFSQGALYPATGVAGLLLVFGIYSLLPSEDSKSTDLLAALEWSEGTEIAQDLDLFEEMASDDWVLTASDEDWEVLLDENET